MLNTLFPNRIQARILKQLARPDYSPMDPEQLAKTLKLKPDQTDALPAVLKKLEEAGKVARIRKNHWILPEHAQLVTGVINFNPKGHAVLIPNELSEPKIDIAAEDTFLALHQDLVVVRKNPSHSSDRVRRRLGQPDRPSGRVIRILKRRRDYYVGTLQRSGRFFHVVPDDPRYVHHFYVGPPSESPCIPKPEIGDKVVLRLTRWDSPQASPEGEITERLGRPGDPGVDILAIIRKHNLRTEFPAEALAEVGDFAHPDGDAPFDPRDRNRLDLRKEMVITIDPDTAKDFDDAIHVTPLGDGRWEVGVHIADVSHYVQDGSALDAEARRRGNSVYLVNQVIPMLPEELSNGLCSLNPHVDRLTFSVIATVDASGRVLSHRITPSVIHSKQRLTYEQAMAALKREPRTEVEQLIHRAWDVASRLRRRRFDAGALDLEMPDVKVILNESGEPTAIERQDYDESHQLIEEFMLMANEVVALELRNRKAVAVFRVHEPPDPEKLAEYRETLAAHGIKVGDLTQIREVRKALAQVAARPDGHALKVGFLRSLRKADYRPQPVGHYGLAKANYTHFTSPIRRYADLIVHRALRTKKRILSPDEMARVAQHISECERIAADAEIESVKLKKLEFFARQLDKDPPESFPAIIMDVMNYGMFVELPDSLMSGLIHVSSLAGDFYHYDERNQCLSGRRGGTVYRMGETIRVVVDRVDILRQQIDFRVEGSPSRSQGGFSAPRASGPSRRSGDRSKSSRKSGRRRSASASASRDSKPATNQADQSNDNTRSSGQLSGKRGRRRSSKPTSSRSSATSAGPGGGTSATAPATPTNPQRQRPRRENKSAPATGNESRKRQRRRRH